MSRARDRAAIKRAADSILAAVRAGVVFRECDPLIRESAAVCRNLLQAPAMYTDEQLEVFVREAARGESLLHGRRSKEAQTACGLCAGVRSLAAEALLSRVQMKGN